MGAVQTFFANIGNFFVNLYLSKNYIQAGAIVILVFLLVLTLAQIRHHYVDWSVKGGLVGLLFGFLLALILEGFLLVAGRTFITEFLGWENAPKPIARALDIGRQKLIGVLTKDSEVLGSNTQVNTASDAVEVLQSLNPSEMKKIKAIICTP